jgi:hypothetical protein
MGILAERDGVSHRSIPLRCADRGAAQPGEGDRLDPNRFDGWTRSLYSRRTLAPLLAGLGLRSAPPTVAAPAAAKTGKGQRFGCTKHDNSCSVASGGSVPCPNAPVGSDGLCVKSNKGKPLCVASQSQCAPCRSNADCAAALGPMAQCVKKCPVCAMRGAPTACVVPLVA